MLFVVPPEDEELDPPEDVALEPDGLELGDDWDALDELDSL